MSQRVTLFEDIFQITALNPEGKTFANTNRLAALGQSFSCELLLDYHAQLLPVRDNARISLLLASTLSPAGVPSTGEYDSSGSKSLADSYSYVIHGRVYLKEHRGDDKVEVQASFGGLLMRLVGGREYLEGVEAGEEIYGLIKEA